MRKEYYVEVENITTGEIFNGVVDEYAKDDLESILLAFDMVEEWAGDYEIVTCEEYTDDTAEAFDWWDIHEDEQMERYFNRKYATV